LESCWVDMFIFLKFYSLFLKMWFEGGSHFRISLLSSGLQWHFLWYVAIQQPGNYICILVCDAQLNSLAIFHFRAIWFKFFSTSSEAFFFHGSSQTRGITTLCGP
jgi:hypothetical protein